MTELLVCETLCETTDFTECKCGYLLVVELKNRKVSSTAVLLRLVRLVRLVRSVD